MLRIKVNHNKLNTESVELFFDSIYDEGERYKIYSFKHGLSSNDELLLYREVGGISFSAVTYFEIEDENNLYIPSFSDITLPIESIEDYNSDKIVYNISKGGNTYKKALVITLSNEHNFIDELKYTNRFINKDYYDTEVSETLGMCEGDYVTLNVNPEEDGDIIGIIYQTTGITDDGHYILGDSLYNIKNANVYFLDENENKRYLKNCIIPVKYNQEYDRNRIIWLYDGEEEDSDGFNKYDYLTDEENGGVILYSEDERFFSKDEEDTFFVKTDTTIYCYNNFLGLSIPLSDSFATDINREDVFERSYVSSKIEDNINDIIDLEKRTFVPVYKNEDGTYSEIDTLKFKIHLRERDIKLDDDKEYYEGSWNSSDEMYWNMYNTGNTDTSNIEKADLISAMGFCDYDAYYQKKKLKKSFLRLTFYDSMNRNKQAIQFYSTLFLDSGKIYTKYVNLIGKYGRNLKNNAAVEFENVSDDDERLALEFSCTNKYNMTECSEGFYVYLFPNLITGNTETTLYMRAEINNAKYGIKVPLTVPIYNGEKVSFGDENFPVNYALEGDTGTDMTKLWEDVYVKVNIAYDNENKRYVWYFSDDVATYLDRVLSLVFYEPRVKGIYGERIES